MNTMTDRFTVNGGPAGAEAYLAEARAARRFTIYLAALLAFALGLTVWLIVSTSVSSVSAAGSSPAAAQAAPEVPYFPSQYVNQATETVPVPPTF